MTQPPTAWPRPPAAAPPPAPRPAAPPARRPAWRDTVDRVRAAATTEPGRLRGIGALLALLLLLFGSLTAWQVSDRADAADAVVSHSQPLSEDAASIYRSLADADTTAAGGFLAGGNEPPEVRERYERDIRRAGELLAKAAAASEGSGPAQRRIARLNRELPRYTGLVEAARANNRQGLPLGGAYLRYAHQRMHQELLPAARALYEAETTRLQDDYARARSWPWLATASGALALAALGWAQHRHHRRTHRVLSPGLVGATAATLVALLWLTGGTALARASLGESDRHGARSLQAINEAWIVSLQVRGAENMWLVARGAGGEYERKAYDLWGRVQGPTPEPGAEDTGGLVDEAYHLADDLAGRTPVAEAQHALHVWYQRHKQAAVAQQDGDYQQAVDLVIGDEGETTGKAFETIDASLRKAAAHEQAEFEAAAGDGRAALTGLAPGAAALAVLGAVAALAGVGRRLAEYR